MSQVLRVADVELFRIALPMRQSFAHAKSSRTVSEAVLVRVRDDDGHEGWGEILPRPYVTGESLDDVTQMYGPGLARALVGATIAGWDGATRWLESQAQRCGQALASLCGFDLALLDLVGQARGESVAVALGGMREPVPPSGVIIGFERPTAMLARYCATLRLAGKQHIKVKVGLEDDEARLTEIARVFKNVPLRLDANCAWTAEEAVDKLLRLAAIAPLHSIEQPVAAADLEGLALVRRRSGVKVMADESVCSLDDAEALIEMEAADIFNVRLGKNGGLWASKRLVERARAAGVDVHLGTMVGESGVLSRAAIVFGRCISGFACLDGKGQNAFLLGADVVDPEPPLEAGPEHPGLGVKVDLHRVRAHAPTKTGTF